MAWFDAQLFPYVLCIAQYRIVSPVAQNGHTFANELKKVAVLGCDDDLRRFPIPFAIGSHPVVHPTVGGLLVANAYVIQRPLHIRQLGKRGALFLHSGKILPVGLVILINIGAVVVALPVKQHRNTGGLNPTDDL